MVSSRILTFFSIFLIFFGNNKFVGNLKYYVRSEKIEIVRDSFEKDEEVESVKDSFTTDESEEYGKTDQLEKDILSALSVTKLLNNGITIDQIRDLAYVKPFVGNFRSYSGYFEVDKTYGSKLFFWFFENEARDPRRPVILWLQGGPGDSFVNTLFFGNGPYTYTHPNNISISETSWTKNYNVLYIDNPVGTGFSYSDKYDGYANTVESVVSHLYTALFQFYTLFPELKNNPFYITGESYAGKYISVLGSFIHRKNKESASLQIPLKGLVIGCGLIDPGNQLYYADYYYQLGFLDRKGYEKADNLEKKLREYIGKRDYINAYYKLIAMGITAYYLELWPPADATNPSWHDTDVLFDNLHTYLQTKEVRKMIHVGNTPFTENKIIIMWKFKNDFFSSVSSNLSEVLQNSKVLLYSGQFDTLIPPVQIENVVAALSWNGSKEFEAAKRTNWYVQNQLAGYKRSGGNLTHVMVRKTNHFIIRSQPLWLKSLLLSFTEENSNKTGGYFSWIG